MLLKSSQVFFLQNIFMALFISENLTSYVTVMVCVAVADEPIFGVVYRPFSDETSTLSFNFSYFIHLVMGLKDFGVINGKGEKQVPPPKPETAKKIIVSRYGYILCFQN